MVPYRSPPPQIYEVQKKANQETSQMKDAKRRLKQRCETDLKHIHDAIQKADLEDAESMKRFAAMKVHPVFLFFFSVSIFHKIFAISSPTILPFYQTFSFKPGLFPRFVVYYDKLFLHTVNICSSRTSGSGSSV